MDEQGTWDTPSDTDEMVEHLAQWRAGGFDSAGRIVP